ncbi:MAG: hypothetical protein CSA75_02620 [Sorangium cellulosum]|nr:MAG: hypothetical protein CSA75_02620 [Sorangium cellulosum]
MEQIPSNESQRVLLELHALLCDLDPSRWRDGVESAFRVRLNRIQKGAAQLKAVAQSEGKMDIVRERLDELVRDIREYSPRQRTSKQAHRGEWMKFRAKVAPSYEAVAYSLRGQSIRVPSLRPTNYARSLFHVFSAFGAITFLEFVLPLWSVPFVTGVVGLSCWLLESARRFWPGFNKALFKLFFLRAIAHPREVHQVNSATWYATALFVLSLLQSPLVGTVALAVLGVGDPAAAMVGRRWGKIRLVHGRSLEGSLTFVVAGTICAWGAMFLFHPEAMWPTTLVLAASAAVFGAIAELFSKRLDDNLTVPLCAAAGTVLAALVTGVPM